VPEAISLSCRITKINDEKRLVVGWASVITDEKDRPIADYQGDIISLDELEAFTWRLVIAGGAGGAGEMHERPAGDVVEAFVVSRERREAMPEVFSPGPGPSGLMIALRINSDETWTAVKDGRLRELSIAGDAERVEV
jgi:hypothetical protein